MDMCSPELLSVRIVINRSARRRGAAARERRHASVQRPTKSSAFHIEYDIFILIFITDS